MVKKKRIVFFALVGATCLLADAPIRAVVLVADRSQLLNKEDLNSLSDLHIVGVDVPGARTKLQNAIVLDCIGQTLTPEAVQSLKQLIYDHYRYYEHPFVAVGLPEQDLSHGVVQLIVQESKLGKISVVGNHWIPAKRVAQYFQLTPGDPICRNVVSKDLNFVNRNPFRRVSVAYTPGDKRNTTDIVLEVDDRRPYRFYLGVDNTGVVATGRQRAFAGFSWDQVFGLDQTFFYQYTTNYDIKRFHANTFQYMAMLPRETILNLYGGFSILHADLPSPSRHNKGTNIQISARYHIPLLPTRTFTQEWIFGFDWKQTNNTMEFTDSTPIFGRTVNLTQFAIGYQWGWDGGPNSVRSEAEVLFSPTDWLPNQSNADFQSLREGAQNKWTYGVFFFNYRRSFSHSFAYTLLFRGQWASGALLPSEQLGVGGYDTVRGYDQRQLNVDNGFYLSNEFHLPTFSWVHPKKGPSDKINLLAFLDVGYGVDKVAVEQVPQKDWLMGIGPGIRYSLGSYLFGRCDLGFKLHKQLFFTGGSPMVHFSLSGSY